MKIERESQQFPSSRIESQHRRSLTKTAQYFARISLATLALHAGVGIPPKESTPRAEAAPLAERSIPKKGQIIFLAKGVEIREGPGKRFKFTVTVPVDNWAVKVIGDKEACADDWIWIDTSRKDAGDPSGGTGWAALFFPCVEPPPPPTQPPTPEPRTPTPQPTEQPKKPEPTPAGTPHDSKPEKGKLYYLKKDTQIREGPGFKFKFTVAVPHDNWGVMAQNVSNSPQCVDDWEWWDISRFLAGDPSGGSGWAAIRKCEISTPIPTPTVNPATPTVEPLPIATPTVQPAPAPQATLRPNPTPKPVEILPSQPPVESPKKPDTGNRTIHVLPKPGTQVDLKKGTEIRSGPGFHFARTIPAEYGGTVPHDNWTALVLPDKPVCAGGWWWINVDRGAIVGSGNGTGWAAYSRCEIIATNPPPSQPVFPGKSSLSPSGLTLGGAIEQKRQAASFLGSLTEAERIAAPSSFGTTGRVANYQGGFIHTSKHGTFETHGDIAQAYLREQGSGGWLGFPTSDEYVDPQTGYARSDFEGGYITWDGTSYKATPWNKVAEVDQDVDDAEIILPEQDDSLLINFFEWLDDASTAIMMSPDLIPPPVLYDDAAKLGVAGIFKVGSRVIIVGKVATYGFEILTIDKNLVKKIVWIENIAQHHPIPSFAKGAAFHLKRIQAYGVRNIKDIEIVVEKGAHRFDIFLKNDTLIEVKSWANETLRKQIANGELYRQLKAYVAQGKRVVLEFAGKMDHFELERIRKDFPMVEVVDGL